MEALQGARGKVAYGLDIETLGLNVDTLGCDDGQGGRDRDTGGEGGDGGRRQVHEAGRIGENGPTAHNLQKSAHAWLSTVLHRLRGAKSAQEPS